MFTRLKILEMNSVIGLVRIWCCIREKKNVNFNIPALDTRVIFKDSLFVHKPFRSIETDYFMWWQTLDYEGDRHPWNAIFLTKGIKNVGHQTFQKETEEQRREWAIGRRKRSGSLPRQSRFHWCIREGEPIQLSWRFIALVGEFQWRTFSVTSHGFGISRGYTQAWGCALNSALGNWQEYKYLYAHFTAQCAKIWL